VSYKVPLYARTKTKVGLYRMTKKVKKTNTFFFAGALLLMISVSSFLFTPLLSQPKEPMLSQAKKSVTAEQLIQMDMDSVFPVIEKLSQEETAALITQLREHLRKQVSDIDKFYFLISHLESIKAIHEEQKRLKSLHIVYGLGLFVFSGLIGFILFSQRSAIRGINQYVSKDE
jgi:hypothetical protein